ncbi:cysteinyl-tRNA synthetase, unknown class [Marinitoga hydrogenitolerans DSM 16785]|uniref:Glycoside-hydrolase family GH114 TIM-barrel domain-containing protein n=1 Tax=Marinitoga hydrogenitolerans (strain DSM 16785 / JCM 12826 / AT1271) TaxID=1122195 RepID=A0A1M4S549_MARH1|nr:MJ1477/TM1410 family putative glycoside hydrolase [Marinitoga hydrogenitolerans]SHE27325.1 cysteinyl-tRNA synthetase, unknown class [Marinitoga hydrogenitolerans DSM 16785]
MEKYIIIIFLIAIISSPIFFTLFIEKVEVPVIYQLTHINLNNITIYYKPKFLVIDYSKDGSKENEFSFSEIQGLNEKGIITLAYLSIGEAEDYRYYWQNKWYDDPPGWLDGENPNWPGNYKVKYWDNEWKEIIFNYLDKIISQGFKGVYLDLVDTYVYWAERGYDKEITASEMIKFVIEIAKYARKKEPAFLIVPQNAENILEYDYNNEYLNTISGIGVESLFYKGENKRSKKYIFNRLKYILTIKNSDKFVLVTDYIYDPGNPNEEKIFDFINLCNKYGFYGYPANKNRKLNDISKALKYFKNEVKK